MGVLDSAWRGSHQKGAKGGRGIHAAKYQKEKREVAVAAKIPAASPKNDPIKTKQSGADIKLIEDIKQYIEKQIETRVEEIEEQFQANLLCRMEQAFKDRLDELERKSKDRFMVI
jgi:hypothetical protein